MVAKTITKKETRQENVSVAVKKKSLKESKPVKAGKPQTFLRSKPAKRGSDDVSLSTQQAISHLKARDKYYQAIGRRKTAVARVRLYTKGTGYVINDKELKAYFPPASLQRIVEAPLKKMKSADRFSIEARVSGGGAHAQADAVRHGISRALVVFNSDFRKRLKRASYLTRDSRMKERRKYGLKKARKAPRWAKR